MRSPRGSADPRIQEWLSKHPRAASPYTRLRITESYDHIDGILARFGPMNRSRALDVGCGTAFDTFALARRFDQVAAIDASRRRILASRVLARRAGVRVEFRRARGETFSAPRPFDFVYCNIMSELASSRRRLVARLAGLSDSASCIYYAEECEGYAPMEIERAVVDRDVTALTRRLHQVVNGFAGVPDFRFYVAGSAKRLFELHGFDLVTDARKTWEGLVYEEALWLHRQPPAHPAVTPESDGDYAEVGSDFHAMREHVRAATGGATPSRPVVDDNRFAAFLPLVELALDVLGRHAGRPPSTLHRLRTRVPIGRRFDWERLQAGVEEFKERLARSPVRTGAEP